MARANDSRTLLALTALAAALCQHAIAQPITVQGPGVDTNQFRITTFASGLNFPLGMVQLADGSLLVTASQGANFFSAPGRVLRLVDANGNGVADGPATVLYTNLPSSLTAISLAGSLVLVTGSGKPINVLRTGAQPSDPLTFVGRITIVYPAGSWEHRNSALHVRKSPGLSNSYDLLFQLGSDDNFAVTTRTATLTNENITGATGTLLGDSIYLLTITDHGSSISASNLTQVARGLRNPAGFAFHPVTGDLYFQDNGIDGLVNVDEPHSADELNFIARTNLGGAVEFFGFPTNYTAYRTGTMVGGAGVQPLIAFQPIPNPSNGRESEGANDITFAPPGFPDGLNTGTFIGFHGRFDGAGVNNEENPVVYANPQTGAYFHFIQGQKAGIGHLDGLLATRDSLFVAELVATGNPSSGAGAGAIYQIKSLVTPTAPTLSARAVGKQIELSWDRGVLQQADELGGPWTPVMDAFSPHLIQPASPRKFYRTSY